MSPVRLFAVSTIPPFAIKHFNWCSEFEPLAKSTLISQYIEDRKVLQRIAEQDRGYPHPSDGRRCSRYAAGGTVLAVTREDFLVQNMNTTIWRNLWNAGRLHHQNGVNSRDVLWIFPSHQYNK